MKRRIKIILLIFLSIIIIAMDIFIGYCHRSFSDSRVLGRGIYCDGYKFEKYNYSENEYLTKSYFHESSREVNAIYYNTMIGDDLEYVKDYIKEHLNMIAKNNESVNIEFDYNVVTEDDLYHLVYNGYYRHFEYYDVEDNIIYNISYTKNK